MIFEKEKVIFVHHPKTGGNSIQDALRSLTGDRIVARKKLQDGQERFNVENRSYERLQKHSPLQAYRTSLGPSFFAYKVFITIRNPFDRLVSYYFSPHRGEVQFNASDFKEVVHSVPTLDHFIRIKQPETHKFEVYSDLTFMKFENLEDDFAKLCEALKVDGIDLPHRNASRRPQYQECYDQELKQWVQDTHKFEISLGNYHF
ncbi:MAG: sulfotransferase family 2 domain-containing protein [Pseudomonadota bacterium]